MPRAAADTASEVHVSSLVVHVRPQLADAAAKAIGALAGAEVHARDPSGKFVVTLETASEFEIVARINAIQDIAGVLSAALVFHRFETDSA